MKFLITIAEKNKSGIYIIRNTIDERVYIGSCLNFEKRFKRHITQLKNGKHHCIHLQRFVDKYGIDILSFGLVEILLDISRQHIELRENYYLKFYKNKFNVLEQAFTMAGFKFTEEQTERKTKAIKKARGTDEQRKQQSDRANEMWAGDGFKEKRRIAHLPSVQSKEYADNMSKIITNRWEDPEYKERVLKAKRKASSSQIVKDKIGKASAALWQTEDYKSKMIGRAVGSRNGNAKITADIALNIKRWLKDGETISKISMLLKITQDIVGDIKRGKTWKHISLAEAMGDYFTEGAKQKTA